MSKRLKDTISYDRRVKAGPYFDAERLVKDMSYFSTFNSQYTDNKELTYTNVQKRRDFCLLEGVNLGKSGKEKFFSKLPCQIEEKMVYTYGYQNRVRKGKPRVIEGRKATGPKNQVSIIRMAELPNTGKARFFYF